MFKKDDYLVCKSRQGLQGGSGFSQNLCFKVTRVFNTGGTHIYFGGIDEHGVYADSIERRATPEEVAEYDRLGKPYDVTALKKADREQKYGHLIGKTVYHSCAGFSYIVDNISSVAPNIKGGAHIYIEGQSFSKKGYLNTTITELREATSEEKAWLDACIAANKYIPKEEALMKVNEPYKEELLAEARRRYPGGTVAKSPSTGVVYTVDSEPRFHFCGNVEVMTKDGAYRNCYDKLTDARWAEIVSTPQPQFEVGKWYRFHWNWEGGYDIIIKISKFSSTNLQGYAYNITQEYEDSNYGVDMKEVKDIREVPLSEIQQYLPEGHPDKFVAAKDEEWEPKAGEWAFTLPDSYGYGMYRADEGKAFIILELGAKIKLDSNSNPQAFKPGTSIAVYRNGIRKALPHEIPGNEQPDTEECEDCEGTGKGMEMRLYPSGPTEVTVDCKTCNGKGLKEDPISNSQLSTNTLTKVDFPWHNHSASCPPDYILKHIDWRDEQLFSCRNGLDPKKSVPKIESVETEVYVPSKTMYL